MCGSHMEVVSWIQSEVDNEVDTHVSSVVDTTDGVPELSGTLSLHGALSSCSWV